MKARNDAIAGGAAGFCSRVVSAPLDLLKIRFQLQSSKAMKYTSMQHAVSSVIEKEGLWALWKGNISATLLWTTYGAAQFTIYGVVKSNITAVVPMDNRYSKISQSVIDGLAGAAACAGSTCVSYPLDLTRTQFAAQGGVRIHQSIIGFIKHTIHDSGIKGLYSGFGVTLIGVVPYMGLNFSLYGIFSRSFGKYNNSSSEHGLSPIASNAMCGALSGALSKLIVYPLDTLKRRFQAQVVDSTFHLTFTEKISAEQLAVHKSKLRVKYKGIYDGMKSIFKKDGIRGFYKGVVPSIWKALVATSINFSVYESLKGRLTE